MSAGQATQAAPAPRFARDLGGLAPGTGPFLVFVGLVGYVVAGRIPATEPYAFVFLGLPAVVVGASVVTRPAVAVTLLFALVGFQGSIQIYTSLPGRLIVDLILVGLWLAVLVKTVTQEQAPRWLMPGVVALGVYILVTFIQAWFAVPASDGLDSIHLSIWLMASVLLIGLSPWSSEMLWSIAKGAVLVAIAVGLYAILRTITGPTDAERELALTGKPGFLQLKASGSTPTSGHLAQWCTAMVPFCLSLTLILKRGTWQVLAGIATALSAYALIATEIRSSLVAGVVGSMLVLILIAASNALPGGLKAVRLAVISILALVVSVAAFSTTVGQSDESTARFERILNPEDDFAYESRLVRWQEALDVMSDSPLGEGLGTQGTIALASTDTDPSLVRQLDSSYMKIGVEQGPWVLGIFCVALLSLLLTLVYRSATTPDPGAAALGIAGAGVLLATAVSFWGNTFIEEPQILAAWLIVGLGVAALSRPASGERLEPDSHGLER